MRLYDLKEFSKLKLPVSKSGGEATEEMITFHHIDGMYSYCTVDGWPEGENVVHLSAVAPLKLVGDHYELDNEPEENEEAN